LPLLIAVLEIGFDTGGVLITRGIWDVLKLEKGHGTMAQGWKRGGKPPGGRSLIGVATASTTGANTDYVDGAMADIVVGISGKILGGKFPVAGHDPLLDPPDDL
jgi:hypothetical protein